MGRSILGAAVKRVEDPRFLTGAGRYLGDLEADGVLAMVPVRSPVPHGTIVSIDTEEAKNAPGVVAVYTASDLDVNPLPVGAPGLDDVTRRPLIAGQRVRFVGDIVAVVVASDERSAVDAAELVWPDIDSLPTVNTPEDGASPEAELLYPELGTNVIYDRGESNESVLADADVVVETTVVNQRIAAVPLEANGALVRPRADGHLDAWFGSQSAHGQQRALATVLDRDPETLHVKVPDVGGGFGAKIALYPEQALCAAIALDLRRPVRWLERRTENMVAMSHGRAQTTRVRVGATNDGVITGISYHVIQDGGAYPQFGSYLPFFTRKMAAGPYLIPKVDFRWKTVVTNTTPIHAYRGAGRPEATMALERVLDCLASELDVDPAELRRRNYIPTDAFPHVTAVDERYDTGDYEGALDLALELSDYDGLRLEQQRRRAKGDRLLLGIGVSSYVEITAAGGRSEWGSVEVAADGTATIYSAGVSQGHSHETTFPQIVAELLKLDPADIRYVQGDTDAIPSSGGTMGSRSLQLAGSAVFGAARTVLEKAREVFARHAEAAPDDVVQFEDGSIGVIGVPSSAMTLGEIAALTDDERGLWSDETFEQAEATFPFGTHVSVVEVDTETGDVRAVDHIACDDAGAIVNRVVVDGQVHGGVAQGIGQALYEKVSYDDANPVTANLTSYLIPAPDSVPSITIGHTETLTDQNPLGVKGIGEAGTIGSTPAVVNAVVDALAHMGVSRLDMPITPTKVWEAIVLARQS